MLGIKGLLGPSVPVLQPGWLNWADTGELPACTSLESVKGKRASLWVCLLPSFVSGTAGLAGVSSKCGVGTVGLCHMVPQSQHLWCVEWPGLDGKHRRLEWGLTHPPVTDSGPRQLLLWPWAMPCSFPFVSAGQRWPKGCCHTLSFLLSRVECYF